MQVGDRVRCIEENNVGAAWGVRGREYVVTAVTNAGRGIRLEGLPNIVAVGRFEVIVPPPPPPVVAPAPRVGTPVVFYVQVMKEDFDDNKRVVLGMDNWELDDAISDANDDDYYTLGRKKKITVYV